MSMDYIRRTYGVPAKRGGRIEYTGMGVPAQGKIVGSDGARLRIRLDGAMRTGIFHPTWKLAYLDAPAPQAHQGGDGPGKG